MDMKKYMGYLPLCMLSIIIVFSLLVYSKRNDFAIGLSTVAAQAVSYTHLDVYKRQV